MIKKEQDDIQEIDDGPCSRKPLSIHGKKELTD